MHYWVGTGDGEFWGISGNFHPILYYKFRGWHKNGGARATVASPSLAPLFIFVDLDLFLVFKKDLVIHTLMK